MHLVSIRLHRIPNRLHYISTRLLLAALVLLLPACTEIPITEADAFQNKRTVTPATFDVPGFTLEQHRVPLADVAVPDSARADSLSLDAWFLRHTGSDGEPARGTVLYFGGQGFLMVTFADFIEAMARHRVNVFMFDYRGYGMSDGTPTVAGLKADGQAVYDYVRALDGVDPDRVVVHGHSMGTFMATHVAQTTDRKPAGLLLESPVTTVEGLTGTLVPALLKPLVSFDIDAALQDEDNLARVAQLPMPTLVVVGSKDNITPPALAEEVYEASAGEPKRLVEIEGGGHNGLEAYDAFHEAIDTFLDAALDG